jgi:tRNA wybutosine-synthesizing protein 4
MLQIYDQRLAGEERARIEHLEMFDEFEEWNMLQSHYCLSLGARSSPAADLS